MATRKPPKQKPDLNVELGAVGADDIGARYVDAIRVSGDALLATRGNSDLAIYEKTLSDPQAYSTFQQRRTSVIEKEWFVEPGGEDPLDLKAAEFLEANLKALPWDNICYKMLVAVWLGFNPGELMYRAEGTMIWIDRILVRKARRFRFGRDGELRLVTKTNAQGTVMPDNKFWILRAGADDDDDPYGVGIASVIYWLVWFKRNALRFWSLFVETMAKGRWTLSHPEGLKPEKLRELRQVLNQVTAGGSATLSDNVILKLVEGMRDSGGDYEKFVNYLDRAISKVVLSQTMTTDSGSSRSQSETHAQVRDAVTKTDADLLCESFNQGPATWLTEWNFPGAKPPKVWRRCEPPEDIASLTDRDKAISELGFEPTQEYIDETYGPGWVKKAPAAPPNPLTLGGDGNDPEFAEGDVLKAKDVVDEKIAEWEKVLTPEVEDIERLLEECGSLDEFQDRLGEVARRAPRALADSLARTMFAARVAGLEGAEVDGHDHD